MRSDLAVVRQRYQGRVDVVVKDPLSMAFFRFQEEEYALLTMLDGQSSLEDMKQRFERKFPPQTITVEELSRFVTTLLGNSLVVADVPGQGETLLKRHRQRRAKERIAAASNILCIRFKGFDPDRLLTWLAGRVGWIFSPAAVALCTLLAVAALLLVTVQWDVFRSRLPAFHDFFAAKNWIYLAATLAVTKILHEFGHGLACKRFGGECHEMGIMILVLTPCLYCNVSDSWMLPNKWRRAAVGAAGMYVEISLAVLCTFLWWFTQPGLLNYLCLNVMFVSSVSTILFNANPLLRYDGYYLLSDLTEIPNLRQKASQILRRKLSRFVLGMEEPHDPFLPRRGQAFFALYTVAAGAYRWFISLSILFFLYRVFEPYGLKRLGQLIAVMALYALAIQPLWQLSKFLFVTGRTDHVNKRHVAATAAVIGVVLLGVMLLPLPHRVTCSVQIEPRDARPVYVDVPGTLTGIDISAGQQVSQDQPLASLENLDLRLAVEQLAGERRQLVTRLASLRHRAFTDDAAAAEVAHVQESLTALDEQLRRRRRDLQRLRITAPAAGVVLPPPRRPKDRQGTGALPAWSGTPLEKTNLGANLDNGVLLCRIGDPRQLETVLAIDQSQIEFVREGQRVDFQLEQLPGKRFTSRIDQVSRLDLKVSPRGLSNKTGGDLVTQTDAAGYERPVETTYQASAELDDKEGVLFLGARGRARIHVGYQTLGRRLWRSLSNTFRFEL